MQALETVIKWRVDREAGKIGWTKGFCKVSKLRGANCGARITFFTADQDETAQEATRNPHFKLLLRLCHMFVQTKSDEETKKKRHKKKGKKEKEQAKYKSAQFIEDSEDEFAEGDAGWEVFLAKEAEARERILKRVMTTEEGEGAGIGMRPTGTKKRRRKGEPGAWKRRHKSQDQNDAGGESSSDGEVPETNAEEQNSPDEERVPTSKPRPRPKPRPKIRRVVASPSPPGLPAVSIGASASVGSPESAPTSD
ncbi:hypothetical protein DL96DRAFT_1692145 [Flagelloscypha sp. PMI_526]|nr:hypothetical protein DL96DRAFT_1692145 [Flagelloscypha sp. PMI_526]